MKVDGIENKSFCKHGHNSEYSFGNGYGGLTSKIDSYMPRGIKGIKRLSNSLGEAQNIVINAIGTGVIAPIFVRYNFLAKTDENTRKYSAMREPISAILAVATQVSAIIPFNNLLNKAFNTGVFDDEYNKTAFMDTDYVRKMMKKAHPELDKASIDKLVYAFEAEQIQKAENELLEKNTIEILRHKQSEPAFFDKKLIDNAVNKVVDDIIESEKEERERLLTTKRQSRIERREFYRTHNKEALNFADEIDEILKNKDLNVVRKQLKAKAKALKKSGAHSELRQITKELLGHARVNVAKNEEERFIWVLQRKLAKIRRVATAYSPETMPNKNAVINAIDEELALRTSQIDKVLEFMEKVKQEIKNGKPVKDIHEMFNVESLSNERLAKKKINFANIVVDRLKTQIGGNAKSLKQMGGLILGLIVLPFTCFLLNKIYPVIMDKMFPEISSSKNNKEPEKKESETVKNG